MFGNLLSDAVEHSDASAPRVENTVEELTNVVQIPIEDNESGVPKKNSIRSSNEDREESRRTVWDSTSFANW